MVRAAGCSLAPRECGAQVVVLGIQPCQPRLLPRSPQFQLRRLGKRQEVAGMPATERFRLSTGYQPLQRILADRFQHHEARLAVCPTLLLQEALIEERAKSVDDV